MIVINENNQLLLQYQQHATIKNKKYNYKELTIPSDIYNYWTQRHNKTINEVTLITTAIAGATTYITPETPTPKALQQLNIEKYSITQLKIRLNKTRPNKEGKQKQKATMTINKEVTLLADDIIFTLNPNVNDFNSSVAGLCTVEGIIVNEEKKVSKEKKE